MPNRDFPRKGAPLPDPVTPEGTVAICIHVPNSLEYLAAFWGQLQQLGTPHFWEWPTPDDQRGLEASQLWRQLTAADMASYALGEECGGVDCCAEILRQLAAIKAAQAAMLNAIRGQNYDGTPTSVNTSAPATTFDGGGDADWQTRDAALCIAVRQYVYGAMQAQIEAAGQAIGLAAPEAIAAILAGGPVTWVVGVVVIAATAFLYQDLIDAASDQDALDDVVCSLYKSLKGLPVTQDNFEGAIDAIPFPGGHADTIAGVVKSARSAQASYLYMVDLLGAANDAAEFGAEGDCCGPDCGFDVLWAETTGGARVIYGTRELGVGVRANTDNGAGGYEARVEFYLADPCSADEFILDFANAGYTGSYDAYIQIRRASDGEWSAQSGEIPPNSTTWGPPSSGWGEFIPYNAVRFRVVNYTTGAKNCIIKRTGIR